MRHMRHIRHKKHMGTANKPRLPYFKHSAGAILEI